jgi:hypothetical protein
MTTLCRRAFVSIFVTLTLSLGACVSASSRPVPDRPISRGANLLSIHFDNLSRQTVDWYQTRVDARSRCAGRCCELAAS